MLQAILFDLDGTLLPMDNDYFTKYYFKYLAKAAAQWGYTDPEALVKALWIGVEAMVKNDGSQSNFDAFWDAFGAVLGKDAKADSDKFDSFYGGEFHLAKAATGEAPLAKEAVALAHQKAKHVILATNPIFPAAATQKRIRWAGLTPEDFELYTTYENSCYCKPNPQYYLEITKQLDVQPEECLMVGNDVSDDMVSRDLGMEVFLLTDCLINKDNVNIDQFPHGGFDQLSGFLTELLSK